MSELLKKASSIIDEIIYADIGVSGGSSSPEHARLVLVGDYIKEGVILINRSKRVLYVNAVARVVLRLGKGSVTSADILDSFRGRFQTVDIFSGFDSIVSGVPLRLPEIQSESEYYQMTLSRTSPEEERASGVFGVVWIEDITESRALEKRKSEFVSVVAHQLRTPLSGLKWTIHMLINGDFGALTNEQKVFLMKAYENNERMISLVNDMLAADRIESGRIQLTLLRINLRDLIENVLFEVFPNAQKRKIKIEFDHPPEQHFFVLVDATKMRAVVQNLLENSIKYTPEGGTVSIHIDKIDADIRVTVSDSGIGIPKSQQGQIFTRFFRAANAIKIEASGTGLGLYMVKKIIEQHGGKVWFESEEGKGTKVYFTLPESLENAPAQKAL